MSAMHVAALRTRTILRLALIATTIMALYWLNFSSTVSRSLEQNRYEAWLKQLEEGAFGEHAREKDEASKELDGVSITLATQVDQALVKWHVSTALLNRSPTEGQLSEEPSAASRMLRMLALIREANLLSLPEQAKLDPAALELKVVTKQGEFKHSFSLASIKDNSPAQLLIKLLHLYAAASSDTQVALANKDKSNEVQTRSVRATQ